MIKNTSLLCSLLILFTGTLSAQPQLLWHKGFTNPFQSLHNTIAVDNQGNLILAGVLYEDADLDSDGLIDAENLGGSDIVLAKYNSNGNLMWHRVLGGIDPTNTTIFGYSHYRRNDNHLVTDVVSSIAVNENNQIYISGRVHGEVDFSGDGIPDLVASENPRPFLAVFDTNGNFLSSTDLPFLETGSLALMVKTYGSDFVYLAGSIPTLEDPMPRFEPSLTHNFFLARYSFQEGLSWIQQSEFDDWGVAQIFDFSIDDDENIYVAGDFIGVMDIDGPGGLDPISSFHQPDVFGTSFIQKYSNSGGLEWGIAPQTTSSDRAVSVDLDAEGNAYVLGAFRGGTISFQDTDGNTIVSDTTLFTGNSYLIKVNPLGHIQWAQIAKIKNDDDMLFNASDIAITTHNDVLMTGTVRGEIDLERDGEFELDINQPSIFVASFTENGQFEGIHLTQQHAPLNPNDHFIWASSFITSPTNQLFLYGNYKGEVTWGADPNEIPTNADETGAGFLVSYQVDETSLPVELSQFEVFTSNQSVSLNWTTLTETNNAGFELQQKGHSSWERIAFISGAGTTSEVQHYQYTIHTLPAGTHTFRLKQIDFDGAFAFSEVVQATLLQDEPYKLGEPYPNPFNPSASITLSIAQPQEVEIRLYNMVGQRISTLYTGLLTEQTRHTFSVDGSGLPSGMYILHVRGASFQEHRTLQLVK